MVKILVAEDDAVMLHLMETLMELEGHEVVTVSRPEQILAVARQESPALIMLDYHLAGGDVSEVLTELDQDDELKDVPVLVASGMDHELHSRKVGADSFILKPFRPTQVIERINHMLAEHEDG
ncbi:MAG: response regulator [Anaerolineae bacterium]